MQGALYALALVPPGLIDFVEWSARDESHALGFWRDHASASFAGGGGAAPHDDGLRPPFAHGGSVEVLRHGLYAEARVEYAREPADLRYRTLRMGRLGHPVPAAAAGVTIGYRDVRGPRPHAGLEVAFPLFVGGPSRWLRLETAYVVSLKQSSWNYRLQGERLLGRGPFFAGACLDLKAWEIRNHGELSHATLTALLGTTFRGR